MHNVGPRAAGLLPSFSFSAGEFIHMLSFRSARRLLPALLLLLPLLASAQDERMPVAVAMPVQAVPTEELRLTGTLVAVQQASLSPRVDGLVAKVNVDAGARVKAGAPLLELDTALERHVLRQREAATAAAQAQVTEDERLVSEAERLARDNHLPQNELALRRAALASSRALLQAAKAEEAGQRERVAWHRLPAPFDGVISHKRTEAGEWVTRGTPVLELVATDRLYLDVQAPQERFAALTPDTQVLVRPDTLTGEVLEARIDALVPVSNVGSRSFLVRVVVQDQQQRLLPGTSATAVFNLAHGSARALLVPRDALLRSPDGSFSLFAIGRQGDDTVALRRRVSIGHQSSAGVEILEGLQPDEAVVVRGNEILRDGQSVQILK